MGKRYDALGILFMAFFFMVIPVGVLTVWFGFLLLPIPWLVAWLVCGVIFTLGIYVWARALVIFKSCLDCHSFKVH